VKLRHLLFLTALLAMLSTLAFPVAVGADDDGDDDGGGGGDRAFCAPESLDASDCVVGLLTFDLDASSGPLGENPMGTFIVDAPGGSYTQRVTCLQVVGNRAHIAGETIDATGVFAPNVGTFQTLTVEDNGPGSAGLDRVSVIFFYATDPSALPLCGALEPQFLVDGDLVVQDNTAGGGDDGNEEDDDGDEDEDDGDEDDDDDGDGDD
jgi:hypothetical protein